MRIQAFKDTVKLTNEGNLQIFFLGTGSAFVKQNHQNNFLIIKGQEHLLVDCGTQCPIAFYKYNSSLMNVENIFLTHSHSDHIGGVEELALMRRYVKQSKIRILIADEYKTLLWNESLKGGLSYGEQRDGRYLEFEDYFEQIVPRKISDDPRPMWEADIGNINIKFFRTMHMPDRVPSWKESAWSTGLLIDNRILFPGDTRFDPELLEWMEKEYHPEVIFHDCQSYTGGVHTGIEELKSLPPEIKKKTYLCHYADNFTNFDAEGAGFAGMTLPGVYYEFE
ncbi:MAG: MBL fold metallo-hydrolase [Treponema sp.]|nr:MBL fold metallo-hydrolase [Treponema sp.]